MARFSRTIGTGRRVSSSLSASFKASRLESTGKLFSTITEIFENLSGEYEYLERNFGIDRPSIHLSKPLPVDYYSATDYIAFLIDRGVLPSDHFHSGYEEVFVDYVKSISDGVAGIDRLGKLVSKVNSDIVRQSDFKTFDVGRTISDLVLVSDSAAKHTDTIRQDIFRSLDELHFSTQFFRSIGEFSTGVDAIRLATENTKQDSVTYSDLIEIILAFEFLVSDHSVAFDTIRKAYVKGIADLTTKVDTTSFAHSKIKQDLTRAVDTIGKAVGRPATDSLTVADFIEIVKQLGRAPTDFVDLFDNNTLSVGKGARDTIGVASLIAKSYDKPQQESVSYSDIIEVLIRSGRFYADLVDIFDSLTLNTNKPTTDTFGVTDQPSKTVGIPQSDSVSLGDFDPILSANLLKQELPVFTDRKAFDLATLKSDIYSIAEVIGKAFGRPASDKTTIADFIEIVTSLGKTLTDLIYFSEDITSFQVGKNFRDSQNVKDTLSRSSQTYRKDFSRSVDEFNRVLTATRIFSEQSMKADRQYKLSSPSKQDLQKVFDSLNIVNDYGRVLLHSKTTADYGTIENQGYVTDNNYFQAGYTGTFTEF